VSSVSEPLPLQAEQRWPNCFSSRPSERASTLAAHSVLEVVPRAPRMEMAIASFLDLDFTEARV